MSWFNYYCNTPNHIISPTIEKCVLTHDTYQLQFL